MNFCSLKNTNAARFARNVEGDFFCDFQTLWKKYNALKECAINHLEPHHTGYDQGNGPKYS